MEGGRMVGTMTCTGGQLPGTMVMKMDGTYSDESYDMTMDMETSGLPGGMTMTVKARTTGERVGDCVGCGGQRPVRARLAVRSGRRAPCILRAGLRPRGGVGAAVWPGRWLFRGRVAVGWRRAP